MYEFTIRLMIRPIFCLTSQKNEKIGILISRLISVNLIPTILNPLNIKFNISFLFRLSQVLFRPVFI